MLRASPSVVSSLGAPVGFESAERASSGEPPSVRPVCPRVAPPDPAGGASCRSRASVARAAVSESAATTSSHELPSTRRVSVAPWPSSTWSSPRTLRPVCRSRTEKRRVAGPAVTRRTGALRACNPRKNVFASEHPGGASKSMRTGTVAGAALEVKPRTTSSKSEMPPPETTGRRWHGSSLMRYSGEGSARIAAGRHGPPARDSRRRVTFLQPCGHGPRGPEDSLPRLLARLRGRRSRPLGWGARLVCRLRLVRRPRARAHELCAGARAGRARERNVGAQPEHAGRTARAGRRRGALRRRGVGSVRVDARPALREHHGARHRGHRSGPRGGRGRRRRGDLGGHAATQRKAVRAPVDGGAPD